MLYKSDRGADLFAGGHEDLYFLRPGRHHHQGRIRGNVSQVVGIHDQFILGAWKSVEMDGQRPVGQHLPVKKVFVDQHYKTSGLYSALSNTIQIFVELPDVTVFYEGLFLAAGTESSCWGQQGIRLVDIDREVGS